MTNTTAAERERKKLINLFRSLRSQERHQFPQSGSPEAPAEKGVYIIRDAKGCVWHVGITGSLRRRLRNHVSPNGESSFSRAKFKGDGRKLRAGFAYQYLVVVDDRQRMLLELLAQGWLCPVHLGSSKAAQ